MLMKIGFVALVFAFCGMGGALIGMLFDRNAIVRIGLAALITAWFVLIVCFLLSLGKVVFV